MIKLFKANERIFTSNGDKIIKPFKAVIIKEDNGDYELELETRIEDKDYIVNDNIIVVNTPFGDQGFRIYNPQFKPNKIVVTCKHLYYDTVNYLITDSYVVDKNCNDALDHLNKAIANGVDVSPFVVDSNITNVKASYRCVRKSFEEAISAVLERWGGHLVRDNFHISIKSEIGQDNGVSLRYGKNINDITKTEDWSKVVTKILPIGKNGLKIDGTKEETTTEETTEGNEDTTNINTKDYSNLYLSTNDIPQQYPEHGITYDRPYTKTVTFTQDLPETASEEELIADLRNQAIEYLRENCVPKVNYTVKAQINKITDVGDTIEVYDERLGINVKTNVISVKWDAIQERYIEVSFGNFTNKLKNLTSSITANTNKEINNAVNNSVVPQIETRLQEAYDKIWNALGSSYCIYEDDQLLVVDKLPKEEATNCIRINSEGIAFSKNGINGQFTSAWLIDGTLNMQNVNVINLVADMIKGGTLKLGSEGAGQGRIELYDSAKKLIGEMNQNGLTMYAKDGSYLKINNEIGLAGFDKNGNKIYWVDGATFCTQKFIAKEEITIANRIRILPLKNGNNEGIAFVPLYEGE